MRVVIAEDSVLLREGIARILTDAGLAVVGLAADVSSVVAAARAASPDVVIVDIRMPPSFTDEGLRAVDLLRAEHGPGLGILVLSQHLEPRFALDLVTGAGGGLGYLLKERVADLEDFVDAIRRVGRGGSIVDPAIVRELLAWRARDVAGRITDRERETLALMAEGRSNSAIAARMGIGPKTVETHVNAIFSKLGLEPTGDDNRRVLAVLSFLGETKAEPAAD
ncbi:MAG: response regulator transcription factor [Chloroflexi bacterium]|nr:response regulator transcription factor [Chloroflexota bacterium]